MSAKLRSLSIMLVFLFPSSVLLTPQLSNNTDWRPENFHFLSTRELLFFRFVTLLLSFSSLSSFIIKFLVCYEYLNIMLYHHRVIYDITTNHYHAYSLLWSRFGASADAFVYRGIPSFQSDPRDIRLSYPLNILSLVFWKFHCLCCIIMT